MPTPTLEELVAQCRSLVEEWFKEAQKFREAASAIDDEEDEEALLNQENCDRLEQCALALQAVLRGPPEEEIQF